MSLHACVGCETAIPFRWTLKNLPFCETCFGFLQPISTRQNSPQNFSEEYLAAFSSYGVSHKILRHWKKHPHTYFENRVFERAAPILQSLAHIHKIENWDYLVPIPQKSDRAFLLGGGPARRIAHRLSKLLEIPIADLLEKENPNLTPQAKKSLQARFESPLVFNVRTDHVFETVGKKALLVDDFMTSGQTLKQAKLALIRSGFDDVRVFVLGHRPHFFNHDA